MASARKTCLEASLTIVDDDGTEAIYKSSGKCEVAVGQVLDLDSLEPFRTTLHCLSASQTRFAPTTPATAPVIEANDGCEHGLFGSAPWLMLNVEQSGLPYTLRGINCQHNNVSLALYDEAGTALLAAGTPEAAPGCQMVRYTFSASSKYAVHVTGMGGDYFLQVTHD